MSIRVIILFILIFSLSIYAWKDWFKSLCGLILMMAIIEHGDMPKNIFAIQGLNPWNMLFIAVFIAWLANRRKEGLRWDMPRCISILLILYLSVVIVGVLRAIFDRSYIEDYPLESLISEELINTIKWVLPSILLYDGCRTRKRTIMTLVCLLTAYFIIGALVVKHMPLSALSGGEAMRLSRVKLNKSIGYYPTDLSVLLGGACWGFLAALPLIRRKSFKIGLLACVVIIIFGQALTGGRAGYVAWAATGFFMCLIKWRKYLLFTPVVILLLPIVFPGAVNRMLEGFGQTNVAGETVADEEAIFSSRLTAWPYIIDKINKSPLIGYGRLAMKRTGLYDDLEIEYPGINMPHPHNMYLETLLDNGIIGSLPIFLLWGIMVYYSSSLFRNTNRLCSAVGGISLALLLSSLVGGLSGQHFYPLEHTLGIWVAMFLMMRVYTEEKHIQMTYIDSTKLQRFLVIREICRGKSIFLI